MADLLECLIQIKALHETVPRLERLLADAPARRWRSRPAPDVWAPLEVLAHLADAELFFGARLRLILTGDRPFLQPFDQDRLAARARYQEWSPQAALERFRARRRENLELLDTCSADDLGRIGIHPARGETTLADLVALLLAHDTDHLGQIRERLRSTSNGER
jgi:uncharacterized damage-inducible protein DinB